jgi:AcrR family transcriptional regulator
MPKKARKAAQPSKRPALRERLLAAGRRLAERGGIEGLGAEAVAREAGLKGGTFARQFPTHSLFLGELMEGFADEVRGTVAKLTLNMAPGLPRMKLAIDSYLAANVQRPALRELVITLRADPAGAEAIRRRILAFMMMMELELKSIKWPRAAAAARLITAAVIEISMAEYEARAPLPEFRSTLYTYLERVPA